MEILDEKWKFIEGASRYQISNLGNLRSVDRLEPSARDEGFFVKYEGKPQAVRCSKKTLIYSPVFVQTLMFRQSALQFIFTSS